MIDTGSPNRRILLITDLWTTHPNGVATVISNLKRELEQKGHTVDLVEPEQFFTVPFPLYPEVRLPLFARRIIRRKILNEHYDHIHLATEGLLGWFARGVCKKNGIPFTTAFNGQLDLYAEVWLGHPFGKFVRSLLTRFHSAASTVLVSTPVLKQQLHEYGLDRVAVCPLGVDPIFFTSGTCPLDLPKPVFMYFGRVSSEKSIDEFLLLDLPGTKLVIGDGPDRKALEKRYPMARFVGYQTGHSLVSWCSCADVLVMPSRTETFGLVIVESLALGIPVAAHDVTGPREIIKNGVNGYLDDNLADAATRCLKLSREACRDSVREYTWSASAERFLSLTDPIHQSLRGVQDDTLG